MNTTLSDAGGAAFDELSESTEGSIQTEIHSELVSAYSTLNDATQKTITDICSSRIALLLIAQDTTGYLAREADMLMNWNDDIQTKGLAKLDEKQFQKVGVAPT